MEDNDKKKGTMRTFGAGVYEGRDEEQRQEVLEPEGAEQERSQDADEAAGEEHELEACVAAHLTRLPPQSQHLCKHKWSCDRPRSLGYRCRCVRGGPCRAPKYHTLSMRSLMCVCVCVSEHLAARWMSAGSMGHVGALRTSVLPLPRRHRVDGGGPLAALYTRLRVDSASPRELCDGRTS